MHPACANVHRTVLVHRIKPISVFLLFVRSLLRVQSVRVAANGSILWWFSSSGGPPERRSVLGPASEHRRGQALNDDLNEMANGPSKTLQCLAQSTQANLVLANVYFLSAVKHFSRAELAFLHSLARRSIRCTVASNAPKRLPKGCLPRLDALERSPGTHRASCAARAERFVCLCKVCVVRFVRCREKPVRRVCVCASHE